MKRWRHLIVVLSLIPFMVLYVALFMFLFEFITGYSMILDWAVYILAGFLWLIPATKVIKWLADHESH